MTTCDCSEINCCMAAEATIGCDCTCARCFFWALRLRFPVAAAEDNEATEEEWESYWREDDYGEECLNVGIYGEESGERTSPWWQWANWEYD